MFHTTYSRQAIISIISAIWDTWASLAYGCACQDEVCHGFWLFVHTERPRAPHVYMHPSKSRRHHCVDGIAFLPLAAVYVLLDECKAISFAWCVVRVAL